jgi:hypothetical protein
LSRQNYKAGKYKSIAKSEDIGRVLGWESIPNCGDGGKKEGVLMSFWGIFENIFSRNE